MPPASAAVRRASLLLPTFTLLDASESGLEGSLDPLGLYALADELGVRLAPGVRERQTRPRFLTAICAGAAVCQGFDLDAVAADGVSEPWQVFEWYVVEGLVRKIADGGRLRGLPGREKVGRAVLRDQVPVSARRYLKHASVAGFHGIYRALAQSLEVASRQALEPCGYELLDVWQKERGLGDFWASRARAALLSAVEDGMKSSATCRRSSGWDGWTWIAEHLAPDTMGVEEKALLARRLRAGQTGFRGVVLDSLIQFLSQNPVDAAERVDERAFHGFLGETAEAGLRDLLTAIGAYEAFARTVTDAFESCLYEVSRVALHAGIGELAKLDPVVTGAAVAAEQVRAAEDALAPLGLSPRLAAFDELAAPGSAADWLDALLRHHARTQTAKQPRPRAPWLIHYADGRLAILPQYRREEPAIFPGRYVHPYRTQPLRRFAQDLSLS